MKINFASLIFMTAFTSYCYASQSLTPEKRAHIIALARIQAEDGVSKNAIARSCQVDALAHQYAQCLLAQAKAKAEANTPAAVAQRALALEQRRLAAQKSRARTIAAAGQRDLAMKQRRQDRLAAKMEQRRAMRAKK